MHIYMDAHIRYTQMNTDSQIVGVISHTFPSFTVC